MEVFIIYCLVTVILASIISLVHSILEKRLIERGWERVSWKVMLLNIILAPITVPWWIFNCIRANRIIK